jgi:hypothetical protein
MLFIDILLCEIQQILKSKCYSLIYCYVKLNKFLFMIISKLAYTRPSDGFGERYKFVNMRFVRLWQVCIGAKEVN